MNRGAVAILPLLLAGCAMTQVADVLHPTISGSVLVRNAAGEEVSWTPDRCRSGDYGYFVGFDFLSARDQGHLRAVLEPIDGPVVRWTSGADHARHPTVLRRADCNLLDVDAQATAWRVNDVREFTGHVELRCDSPDGTHLEGRIAVDHCH